MHENTSTTHLQKRQKEQQQDIQMKFQRDKSTDQTSVMSPLRSPKINEQKNKNAVLPKDDANDTDNSDEDDNAVAGVRFLFHLFFHLSLY